MKNDNVINKSENLREVPGVSLTDTLLLTAGELESVSKNIKGKILKKQYYDKIYIKLEEFRTMIINDMDSLEKAEPEDLPEEYVIIEETLLQCQNYFLDSIEAMMDFMENENPELIEKARTSLMVCDKFLHKGQSLCENLSEDNDKETLV